MSTFTNYIKEEVCRNTYSDYELKFLLSAFLKNNISINIKENNLTWELKTKSPLIARFLYTSIDKIYNFNKYFSYDEQNKNKKNRFYKIKFLGSFDVLETNLFLLKDSSLFMKNENHKKAFLSGCFLSGGSVNNPNRSNYHLEIRFTNLSLSEEAYKIIIKIAKNVKMFMRNQNRIIYIKKSEQISDFLKYIGAMNSMINYEEKRITRDYSNQMHRLNNLDISNLKKTVNASNTQIVIIKEIKKDISLYDKLSEKEKIFCSIRLKKPEFSLNQIVKEFYEKYNIKISKSALNHYSRKIKNLKKIN